MELRTFTFTVPSGSEFTIREQNGEDEDILSNPIDMQNLMHLTKYITAITVKTNATKSGRLTIQDALALPLLDRYCIIIKSRIFSIGETMEFPYHWPKMKEPLMYEENLKDYVFDDYSNVTEEEMDAKPNAIPLYSDPENLKGRVIELSSGKIISFDCATGSSEQAILALPDDRKGQNANLLARNLHLQVDGKMEKVTNFSHFSPKDMAELRKYMGMYDPVWSGLTGVTNPTTNETLQLPIIAIPNFFFLTEA